MRLMLAGGAPLSKEVHDFMRVCLGSTLIQGYGLTEVTACATLMAMDDLGTEVCGIPNQVSKIIFELFPHDSKSQKKFPI